MKTITVIETNDITAYPPVQNLIKVLLHKGYHVNFIGKRIENISIDIKANGLFTGYEVGCFRKTDSTIKMIIERLYKLVLVRKYLKKCMAESDVLWTTSLDAIRIVGKSATRYRNVLQLMELVEHGYYYRRYFRFPLEKYARMSWKTVVPEINRAYIQKVWWNLPKTPYVLPNKPYDLDFDKNSVELKQVEAVLKKEKKKIILYLGGIYADRNFENYAKILRSMNGYAFYIIGKIYTQDGKKQISDLISKYNVVYLGSFYPPTHLALVKYAYIGLLPYVPQKSGTQSCLNALYCAPNKIFEYAGFGVPMVGSDVLGLKFSFEQWNIGCCCDINDENSIRKAIEKVDMNHNEMSENCYKFYDSVNLDKIVAEILED